MSIINILLAILNAIATNAQLRAALIRPLADLLVDVLPDPTEDQIAALLRELADQVEAAN